jgi:hypothetical protein
LGLYVDRVIACGDISRLGDARVREAVRQAVGLFPGLTPKMATAVAGPTGPEDISAEDVP